MGHQAPRGRYVQVYINGEYHGLHNLMERPNDAFMASYFGGSKEDYDALNAGKAIDGDRNRWNEMVAAINAQDWSLIQQHMDVENYVDYMLLEFYSGNDWDWRPSQNWAAASARVGGEGYQFFAWDSDVKLRTNPNANVVNKGGPENLWPTISQIPEFRLLLADRVHAHFYNNGVFTTAQVLSQIDQLADETALPVIAETARWDSNYTPDSWQGYVDWIRDTFVPGRTETVLTQLNSYLPNTDAPAFNQHGGVVPNGFDLEMSAPAGIIYYTLDGSDPREIGGSIGGSAIQYTGVPVDLTTAATVRARALSDGEWSAINEASFIVDALANSSNLAVSELHYHPADPTPEELAAGFTDGDEFEFIELLNTSAQPIELQQVVLSSAVDFIFDGSTVLQPGERAVLVENLDAFAARYGESPRVLGQWSGQLSNGGETVTLTDSTGSTILCFTYDDADGWPAAADGHGPSLEIIDPLGDPTNPSNWRASFANGGSPGSAGVTPFLAGDYDRNGAVTGADFSVWRNQFGSTPSTPGDGADGNSDGVVDAVDYAVWRNNLGATIQPSLIAATYTTSDSTPQAAPSAVDQAVVGSAIGGASERGLPTGSWLPTYTLQVSQPMSRSGSPPAEVASGRIEAAQANNEVLLLAFETYWTQPIDRDEPTTPTPNDDTLLARDRDESFELALLELFRMPVPWTPSDNESSSFTGEPSREQPNVSSGAFEPDADERVKTDR